MIRPPPTTPISYTLPDNQEVHLDQDAYYIPEVIMTGNGTVFVSPSHEP